MAVVSVVRGVLAVAGLVVLGAPVLAVFAVGAGQVALHLIEQRGGSGRLAAMTALGVGCVHRCSSPSEPSCPPPKRLAPSSGPLMAAMFIPFYAYSLIISDPDSLIVQVFTYFPLTVPVTAMLRNGFGTLGTGEAAIVIAELFIIGVLILRLGVHLFRYGSIECGKKLSIAGSFRREELAVK